MLIDIIRKELKINTSLYTLLQILSVSVFEKSVISLAFQPGRQIEDNEDHGSRCFGATQKNPLNAQTISNELSRINLFNFGLSKQL